MFRTDRNGDLSTIDQDAGDNVDYAAFWKQHAAQATAPEQSAGKTLCSGGSAIVSWDNLAQVWQRASWWRVIEAFELQVEGLLAVCIQHEMDHLEGKLFVDYLSQLKRQRIRKKLQKERRHAAVAM